MIFLVSYNATGYYGSTCGIKTVTELLAPSLPKLPDQKSMHLLALVLKSVFLNIVFYPLQRTILSVSTFHLVNH